MAPSSAAGSRRHAHDAGREGAVAVRELWIVHGEREAHVAVVAVLRTHQLAPTCYRSGQLAGHLDGLGAGGGEERVAQRLGQQASKRRGALGAPQRRQQPVAHVVVAHGRRQRVHRELRMVAEIEYPAGAAAVDVVAALEVPDPRALTPTLDDVDAERAEGLGLVRRQMARDQREGLGVGCRMFVHDAHLGSLSGSSGVRSDRAASATRRSSTGHPSRSWTWSRASTACGS
jgi:hypothetical protein